MNQYKKKEYQTGAINKKSTMPSTAKYNLLQKLAAIAMLSWVLIVCPVILSARENPSLPDARGRAHFIYHPKSKAMLLIDGYANYLDFPQNDVWKWDGIQWQAIKASGPDSRCGNAAALDKKSGNVVTFGGWGKGGPATDTRNDVWQFDGKGWRSIPTSFIDRHDHVKMVYADHLEAFVVYGGFNSKSQTFDSTTWLLKNGNFIALHLAGPGARGNAAFAYDSHRKKVVLFGGKGYNIPADLWEFDGRAWKQIPVHDIGMTTGMEMTYSDDMKMVIVHGHTGTWAWNGSNMKKIAGGGPDGSNIAFAYDPKRKVLVAYGGYNSDNSISSALWELKDGVWKNILDNGTWKRMNNGRYERRTAEK